MPKQIFNPLLPKRFQELSSGAGGGEDLAATLLLGPATGGADIILTGSDAIKSINSQLLLNDTSGAWLLTFSSIIDGSTEFQTSYIWGDGTTVFMEQGADSGVLVSTSSAKMYIDASASGLIGDAYMFLGVNQMGFGDETAFVTSTIQINNNSLSAKGSAGGANRALFLNSLSSIINSGVNNSLILGGNNLTAKTSNTPYANQISLQPSGNLFDGLLVPPALSGDQTYTFQDASGTVAFLSDITGGGYIQTATTVNATPFLLTSSKAIANGTVQSFVTRVTAISTVLGNVWCHEFRGAIKQFGGATSIVDTVTDEMIAEDVATAAWGAAITAVPGSMSITVTGAAVNIKWKAETVFSEILI